MVMTPKKLPVAIPGIGNIETDLLIKILGSPRWSDQSSAHSQGVGAFLTKLLLFTVISQAIRPPHFPNTEYSARMMDCFDPVAKFHGYIILQKKKPAL